MSSYSKNIWFFKPFNLFLRIFANKTIDEMTSKKKNSKEKAELIKKLLETKLALKTRVRNGESLKEVAKDLGVRVVQPL